MSGDQASVPVDVSIEEIDRDFRPASQMRAKLDRGAIDEYADAFEHLPPVVLIYDPVEKKHWVENGAHRLKAALKRKRKTVLAVVKTGSYLDAFKAASHANAENNSIRVTNEDKHYRVKVALKDPVMKKYSARMLADFCGVHNTFVLKVKSESTADKQQLNGEQEKTIGKDGKARKPPKPRKSKEPANNPPIPAANGQVGTTESTPQAEGSSSDLSPQPDADPIPALQVNPSSPFNFKKFWSEFESYLDRIYDEIPTERRGTFVFEGLCYFQKMCALRHPEIEDRKHESLLRVEGDHS